MKAAVLNPVSLKLQIKEVKVPSVADSEVLIKLNTSALNHREVWYLQGREVQSDVEIIMGSDGAGTVIETGSAVNQSWIGKEVIINPSIDWGPDSKSQGPGYEILGIPSWGTLAEYICLDAKYIYKKPAHLSLEEAAAIPLAGLTAYRALFTRGEFQPGQKVLITGIGGGAALFSMIFALASEAIVFVTSSDNNKIKRAIEMGAMGGVNYKTPEWSSELQNISSGFDVIVDSAGGSGFPELISLAKPGGRIAIFGRTAGDIPPLDPSKIFYKQLSIHGTTMGSDDEFRKMTELVSSKKIHPVIDSIYPLADVKKAYDKMQSGKQFGKILIKIPEQN